MRARLSQRASGGIAKRWVWVAKHSVLREEHAAALTHAVPNRTADAGLGT